QGREDEAMDQFRAAASKSPEYRDQVFSIVWEYFEKDPKRLDQLADQRPEVRAGLAKFYAARELPVESLRVWNTLSAEEKQDHHDVAKVIAQALYEKRFFRSAVAYVKQLGLESGAELGVIQNPGFETPFEDPQKVYFGWKSVRLEKTDVRSDQIKKHGGNRSLRIAFSGYNGIEVKNVWQVAAVQSSKRYRVRFWVRTEDLKSAGPPLIEIVNANDNKILATSPAFPTGNNDWTEMKVEFEVPETAEGILVRLDRAYCGDACPIFGSVWLDDFVLEAE
ncbi:MAG TPA: carbohydrate binding domain-containing protein, partial [Pyrinomonadaceae bacterium]|nr:carbohydrate binding domain-containing protein [Pyrinomonadaceae bacterium]